MNLCVICVCLINLFVHLTSKIGSDDSLRWYKIFVENDLGKCCKMCGYLFSNRFSKEQI